MDERLSEGEIPRARPSSRSANGIIFGLRKQQRRVEVREGRKEEPGENEGPEEEEEEGSGGDDTAA